MEQVDVGKCKSKCMSLFDLVGPCLFLLDVYLDVRMVLSFYQQEDYVFMGLLTFILLGSSLLVNTFSLLWYLYDNDGTETRKENCVKNICPLIILHAFLFGFLSRYAGVLKTLICGICCGVYDAAGQTSPKHDLSILLLFDAFSESAPQLVLMLTIIFQRGDVNLIPLLKAFGSAAALSFSVTMYHRSLRSFLPDKNEQSWGSSVLYFLWNLLLIGSRVAAVALFASVFPCYIAAHFLCSWMVLFLCAWRLHTDFMESTGGERLYKATIGIIWYFTWFNVVKGHTRSKRNIYHVWILVDNVILCGVWIWQMKKSPPYFHFSIDPVVIFMVVTLLYILGLCLMVIYYKYCHPILKQAECVERLKEPLKENDVDPIGFRSMGLADNSSEPPERVNRRMKNLADNFYYRPGSLMIP
ncbi:hypothetical protein DPEC_G00288580 [Dallia pectoralis]|uniref:Uncharacterized protein n=1 Tax=Dallia pectoralis TaxID=75939 RepID=A0ACC2FKS2_DALPE|nr:hypothetical protein DPEC_G00288580 [Dallia pectoralis]